MVTGSRLAQRVADLITAGAVQAARDLAATATTARDRAALDALGDHLVARLRRLRATDPSAALRAAAAAVAVAPDHPAALRGHARLLWSGTDEAALLAALARLAASQPDDPWLAERLHRDATVLAAAEAKPAVLIGAGLRLAACGRLTGAAALHLLEALRRVKAPRTRFEQLRALAPDLIAQPEVVARLEAWQREAVARTDGMELLDHLSALLPAQRMSAEVTEYLLRREAPVPAALLPALCDAPPALAAKAAGAWRQALRAARTGRDPHLATALLDSLDAIGAADANDIRIALLALDEAEDPDGLLPALITRAVAAGGESAVPAALQTRWRTELVAAHRAGQAERVWRFGTYLRAAGAATPDVLERMLAAAGRTEVPGEALIAMVEAWDAADVPGRDRMPRLAADGIAAAALARINRGEAESGLRALAWLAHHHGAGLAGLEAVAAAETPLDSLAERRPAITAFLQALRGFARGAHARGAAGMERALALGLKPPLAAVAAAELRAATFRPVSAETHDGEDAVVLIETGAATSLVSRAAAIAPRLDVCGATYLPEAEPEGEETREIDFRVVDLPEVSEGIEALSRDYLRRLQRAARDLSIPFPVPVRHIEPLRQDLFMRGYGPLREAYNFRQALAASGRRRAFFVVAGGKSARIVARHLLEQGGWDVRVASGLPVAAGRRRFEPETVVAPVSRLARSAETGEAAIRSARLPHIPPCAGIAGRPACLVIVPSGRNDVLAPLGDLLAGLCQDWAPVVLFFGTAESSAFIRGALANDARPEVARAPFHVLDIVALRAALRSDAQAEALRTLRDHAEADAPGILIDGMRVGPDSLDMFGVLPENATLARHLEGWFRRLVETHRPAFALFQHSARFEVNIACIALEEAGVPTFWQQMLQHPRDRRFMRPFARHHLLLDRYSAELWHDFIGVPREDVTVVGSLRMNATLARVRGMAQGDTRAELGLGPADRMVLVGTQPIAANDNLALIRLVGRALRGVPDMRIMVKLHPAEAAERIPLYARALEEEGVAGISTVSATHDVYRAVLACDLCVVQFSNLAIEAVFMDRLALSVTAGERIATFSLGEHGIVEEAPDPAAAEARIRAIFTDPAVRAEADAALARVRAANLELHDGRVVERIRDAIRRVIGKGVG